MKKKKIVKKKTPMPKAALPWVRNKEAEVKRIWWYQEMVGDAIMMYASSFLNEHEASIVFKGKPKYGKTNILMEKV